MATATKVLRIPFSKLANTREAVLDIGGYTITITPKFLNGNGNKRKRMGESDERVWQMIEKDYRKVRSTLARERSPYLYLK